MKIFVVITSLLAIAAASDEYLNAVPVHLLPLWQELHPNWEKFFPAVASGTGRIIGGSEASIGQFPHQVTVNLNTGGGSALCGGSLIHAEWILTAAHCIDMPLASVEIYLGTHSRSNPQQRRTTSSNTKNPNYNPNTFHNDVAVLRIPAADVGGNVAVIALARDTGNTWAGVSATVSGWGLTSDGGSTAGNLQYVTRSVITNSACAAIYGDAVIGSTICTDASTCSGDSGGPLIASGQQIGVVSFGAAASCASFPSAFARVSHFVDWISQATNGAV